MNHILKIFLIAIISVFVLTCGSAKEETKTNVDEVTPVTIPPTSTTVKYSITNNRTVPVTGFYVDDANVKNRIIRNGCNGKNLLKESLAAGQKIDITSDLCGAKYHACYESPEGMQYLVGVNKTVTCGYTISNSPSDANLPLSTFFEVKNKNTDTSGAKDIIDILITKDGETSGMNILKEVGKSSLKATKSFKFSTIMCGAGDFNMHVKYENENFHNTINFGTLAAPDKKIKIPCGQITNYKVITLGP